MDIDDLGTEQVHRLGSLHKARLKSDTPKRPIIAAFYEYRHTESVLNASYMLRNTSFSVSRDYPKELVSARQRLLPQFKMERQNRNNKVSIVYPAKLMVNGRVIADELPDWYSVLSQDRFKSVNGKPFIDISQQQQQQQQQEQHVWRQQQLLRQLQQQQLLDQQ